MTPAGTAPRSSSPKKKKKKKKKGLAAALLRSESETPGCHATNSRRSSRDPSDDDEGQCGRKDRKSSVQPWQGGEGGADNQQGTLFSGALVDQRQNAYEDDRRPDDPE